MLAAHAWPVHLLAPPRHVRRIAPDLTFARHHTRAATRLRPHSRQPATPVAGAAAGGQPNQPRRPEQPQLAAAALRPASAGTPPAAAPVLHRLPRLRIARQRCAVDASSACSSVAAPPAATPCCRIRSPR
eukprot:4023458-Prymnesium_polylepis.1